LFAQVRRALGKRDAALQQEAANLVDDRRAVMDDAVADAMECLFRNGFTNCAGMSRTSWPWSRTAAPMKCAPEQASMPINELVRFAV
jgi:hypothetical protein